MFPVDWLLVVGSDGCHFGVGKPADRKLGYRHFDRLRDRGIRGFVAAT